MSYDPRQGSSPYLGMETDDLRLDDERPRQGAVADASEEVGSAPKTTRVERSSRRMQAPGVTTRVETRRVSTAPASHGVSVVPPTVHRPAGAATRGVSPYETTAAPLRRASAPAPHPQRRVVVAAPPQAPRTPHAGPFALLGSFALRVLSLMARFAALALSVVVIAAAVTTNAQRTSVVTALNYASMLVPTGLAGSFVRETPFGGAFRGDLALVSTFLFIIDWLCLRLSTSLREGRERGD